MHVWGHSPTSNILIISMSVVYTSLLETVFALVSANASPSHLSLTGHTSDMAPHLWAEAAMQDSQRFVTSYFLQEAKYSALYFGEVAEHELIPFSNCVMTFGLSYKVSNRLIEPLAQVRHKKKKQNKTLKVWFSFNCCGNRSETK